MILFQPRIQIRRFDNQFGGFLAGFLDVAAPSREGTVCIWSCGTAYASMGSGLGVHCYEKLEEVS
jgi:hypothetical protein